MNRRSFLAATVGTAAVSLAGCTSFFEASMPEELDGVDAERQLPVPTLGEGAVTVAVYEDLACPHCQEFEADVFPVLEEEYVTTDEIEYRHRDFVVMVADESAAMANAARAVQDDTRGDGDDDDDPNGEFFEYKRTVMTEDVRSDDALIATAEDVGADPAVVADALEDETYYPTLVADWERGEDEGVQGTPTVFVDGETVDEPTDPDAVVDAIEDALA